MPTLTQHELTAEQMTNLGQIMLKCGGLGFPVNFAYLTVGPRVESYYLTQQFNSGAPLSKIINRSEDIALACKVESVMISRDREFIVVQVPRSNAEVIKFDQSIHYMMTTREIWSTINNPNHETYKLPLIMGKTTEGTDFTVDLAEQPHLLIAGSTGSGKSVFQGLLVSSLALIKTPKQLEFYMIDTKQLDLPLFQALPHTKTVASSIIKVHNIMDNLLENTRRRNHVFKGRYRNIREYNDDAANIPLPYKVLVIDELADIISLDNELKNEEREEIKDKDHDRETHRTRFINKLQTLTQISRAAGIHVIAATQRPSVKLMSGDIKANFPMRVAFKLPTSADSRVILGEGGAENLLGKGDYLYETFTMPAPVRAHGAFVTTQDIKTVIASAEQIREQYEFIRQ